MTAIFKNRFSRWIMKHWYPMVTKISGDHGVVFMNYGYSDPEFNKDKLPLEDHDEDDRYFIQLYHHVASYLDLQDKDVLEVSSGHGGGASYISRYLKPKSYTGLERNHKAVEFCLNKHTAPGLFFVQGDACDIRLEDESVDAVINVEASHVYGDVDKFFSGVSRVLRPEGHFLTTDFRPVDKLDLWKDRMISKGLKPVREVDITKNVLEALDHVHDLRMGLIDKLAPKTLRHWFKQFAGVKGSDIYENLRNGTVAYKTFALQKIRY